MVKTGIRWPVSRVLFTTCVDWRPFLWDDDCSSPRATDPEDGVKTHRMSSLFGLAPGGVYLARSVARSAVRSYRTLSPLPRTRSRRFAFCGTIPRLSPGGRYPPPCFHGARTFLHSGRTGTAAARPSDQKLHYTSWNESATIHVAQD